jgi:hypothetical protein
MKKKKVMSSEAPFFVRIIQDRKKLSAFLSVVKIEKEQEMINLISESFNCNSITPIRGPAFIAISRPDKESTEVPKGYVGLAVVLKIKITFKDLKELRHEMGRDHLYTIQKEK